MKKYTGGDQGGFTLLIILGVIGFLLILLTGIFKLVTLELKDTKNMDYHLKSKGAAEAGQELALLKLKEEKFGYDGEVDYDPTSPRNDPSLILSENPTNTNSYHANKDVSLGYKIYSEATSYTGTLEQGDFQVIPLFVKRDGGLSVKTRQPSATITSLTGNNFAWNIIGEQAGEPTGISGNNAFSYSELTRIKSLIDGSGGYANERAFDIDEEKTIQEFLENSDNNYLTIFNKGATPINYKIETPGGVPEDSFVISPTKDYFTKPVTTVISQAKIGEIKQNIQLEIFNDKYFDVLKYSLFDG